MKYYSTLTWNIVNVICLSIVTYCTWFDPACRDVVCTVLFVVHCICVVAHSHLNVIVPIYQPPPSAMPAETVDLGDETRPSHRARRTEAMPKVSLFGSSLEILNEESAQSVRDLEPSKVPLPRTPGGKGPGQRFCLPEDVKRKLPGVHLFIIIYHI